MGQIEIELLSDSCIASGEVYNSSIDSDVCYDSYGLPFIPAKRIRGCLREAALELRDFGMDIKVEELFGEGGNSRAVFVLGSARLKYYDIYVRLLRNCHKTEYTHQQTVLDQFTYIRYQTKIEKATGTAEDTSLRATRVMKKGLTFVADMEIPPEYEKTIRLCCQNLRSMGMNRTRGMGEVKVKYSSENRERHQPKHESWMDGIVYERLDYQIKLKAPVLIKSVAGGQTKTVPYIDGAKILGILAEHLSGNGLMELQGKGKLICANAYISDGEKRYTPISASLCGIKNEKGTVRDKACREAEEKGNEEGRQLVQLDGSYVDSDTARTIKRLTVDTEIRYHHARPEDKSVGHVIGNGANSQKTGSFYQMESIAEGQIFSGYILGTTEQLKKVYDIFTEKPLQRLGYGKSSEYGEVEFTITSLGTQEITELCCSSFVVKLNAPVILYNENAMYAADEGLLVSYIAEVIKEKAGLSQPPKLDIVDRFLKYNTVGGFNTTWGLHKPVINTFDAGTTLVLKVNGQEGTGTVDIGRMKNVFLGERISEGYGEAVFYPCPDDYEKSFDKPKIATKEAESEGRAEESDLIGLIATKQAYAYIKDLARKEAGRKKVTDQPNTNAVVANLLMMCGQQETFEGFQKNIKDRFEKNNEDKTAKLEIAGKIIPGNLENVIQEAQGKYGEAILEENKVYKVYIMALLTTLKYMVREEKE